MGVIKKQSIASTVYLYIGVVLGFITTGIVFPNALTTDEVGLLRLLVSVALIVSQFAGLGFHSPTIRLFPYFRNKKKAHHGFLSISLLVSFTGLALFLTLLFVLKPWIVSHYGEKSSLFVDYFYYLIPLVAFTLLFNSLNSYCKSLYDAVIGVALKDVWQRVFILISVLSYYFKLIDFNRLVLFYVISVSLPTVLMVISLIKRGEFALGWDRKFLTADLIKSLVNMSFYGILNGFSGIMVLNVDILMINHMLGLGQTGIYSVTMSFGSLISMPARSIRNISSVVIAEAWKSDDRDLINNVYKKSSLALTTLGLLLFVGLWGNIDNVFRIIGDQYLTGKYVILFIGLANLIDISTGLNIIILNTSVHYRYLTWSILLLLFLIVTTNLIFIPYFGVLYGTEYGIVGAAFASALSKLVYNFVVCFFLWSKFRLQPLSSKFLVLLGIAVVSYICSRMLPQLSLLPLDILVRSAIISVIFISLSYFFKTSDDINNAISSVFNKIFH